MDLNGEVPRGPLDAFFMSRPRYIHLGTSSSKRACPSFSSSSSLSPAPLARHVHHYFFPLPRTRARDVVGCRTLLAG